MYRNLRGLALRGALGGLMIAAGLTGLMGAPAFAAGGHGHGHGHSGQTPSNSNVTNAHAKLDATPTGSASLTWDKATQQLSVSLSLTGLTPGASYTASLEQGTCKNASAASLVDALTGITADTHGNGTSQTSVANVTSRIPHSGWFVAIDQGSTMLACGAVRDVHNMDKGRGHLGRHNGHEGHQGNTQTVSEKASAKLDATQKVGGEAHLQLKGGTLTVSLNAHGLTAGNTYLAMLGQGSCSMLGSPVLALNSLTQSAHGGWSSTTTKTGVTSFPTGPLFVAIGSANSSTLLACGNVRGEGHK